MDKKWIKTGPYSLYILVKHMYSFKWKPVYILVRVNVIECTVVPKKCMKMSERFKVTKFEEPTGKTYKNYGATSAESDVELKGKLLPDPG